MSDRRRSRVQALGRRGATGRRGARLAGVVGTLLAAGGAVASILTSSSSHGLRARSPSAPRQTTIYDAVCSPRVVITRAQRLAAGLDTWPDGTFGIVSLGGRDRFIAANGGTGAAATGGTSDDPLAYGVAADPRIVVHPAANYASGGPVYRVSSRRWLLLYHAERWRDNDPNRFYSWIGMAVSTDQGRSWRDLGEIIRPQHSYRSADIRPVEVGGAPFVVVGGFFYVYFRDTLRGGSGFGILPPPTVNLAVARAPVRAVIAAAAHGRVVAWHNYDAGRWQQSARGGRATALETDNPPTRWFDVGFDPAVDRYVLVVAANNLIQGVNLSISFSRDGLRWTSRRPLTSGVNESFYPTLVGTGRNPLALGRAFYVYYTSSRLGGARRWSDAVLARLTIRLGATPPRCQPGGRGNR